MTAPPKHAHCIGVDDLAGLEPGTPVLLPTGHAAVVVAVDQERGQVEVESTPWRASFKPAHLRRPGGEGGQ